MADQGPAVATTAVRVRENPARRRERIARVSRALALAVVRTGPEDRRGLPFGRVVAEGLRALRPNLVADVSGAVLDAAAAAALEAVAEMDGGNLAELRAQIAQLRARLPLAYRVGEQDLARMREMRAQGRTFREIAEDTGLSVEQVRYLLGAKKRGGGRALLPAPDERQRIAGPED
ncbi:hypothetical protein JYK14_07830 [Siccirubricoccus sp. KC 17139]|uniref:Sigma-70 family RNA polymerase sigma factor n=1 Tax=Siccirubricoccus soli TaxID=2899147 RepID=A0ABT1D2C9_9PROT|nr:hypothetical protein [Siccirubricoccus soli]MCO6416079.1 hypothetical protein [Siccirubricoccus soli]MCP2682211.1 hypothetical protein [Siccirubricoccus soli]